MFKEFLNNFDNITSYYNFLVRRTKKLEYVGITNEWLIDNYYLLVEYKNSIIVDTKVLQRQIKKYQNIAQILKEIVIDCNYNIDFKILKKRLNIYQRENQYYFSYIEIYLIKVFLLFIYTDKLNEVCNISYKNYLNKKRVEKIIKVKGTNNISLDDFFSKEKDFKDINYIFEINSKLKNLGFNRNKAFKDLNDLLSLNKTNLKEVLNLEYQNKIDSNILISSIFNNLKRFNEYSNEQMLDNISFVEKEIKKDKSYENSSYETKNMYREYIIKNAKKKKVSEYRYVNNLNKRIHIGNSILKNKNVDIRFKTYISLIFILSTITSFVLSKYFITYRLIGFIILFIPIMQLFAQIINNVLINTNKPKPLPKINFLKGLDKENATMVVIPTILDGTDKVKKMFDNLETYYLVNKTRNLYFTLLGDVKASCKEFEETDDLISEYGINYCRELNSKYHKNLFHFVYRKRVFNESENMYLGYERKRGALLHFNRLLLKKLPKDEEDKYIKVHTFDDFDINIKYVITLDTDTKLVLNTALKLIGAMAHPMNKPVLNADETKVISGYAIMQPKVNVDIECTNKSLYTQIFASIGGFDSYTSVVPNIYQDNFDEGSFVGKGIYDLEVFDKILYNNFPDDLILSHDLLEGNYLRCAFVSDVELIDDFPSNFLADTKRQHRWARGDTQIIAWLFSKVRNKDNKKVNNPLNLLERFKILDNILRLFLPLSLLLIIILPIFIGKTKPVFWLLIILLEIMLPILNYLKSKYYNTNKELKIVYYKNVLTGFRSMILRSFIILITLPYYTKLYLDAFIKSIYRMFISKKNLLNWITSEEVEKKTKQDLSSYIINFTFNNLLSILLILWSILNHNIYSLIIGILFLSAPIIMYLVSKSLSVDIPKLNHEKNNNIETIAYRTWCYFEEYLTEEHNYLIPDNYQENREEKIVNRTSPTNIGFSLTSIVCAYELKFISFDKALYLIEEVIKTVKLLNKWNGHLFNWYNIKTKEVLFPYTVSTIDSGNFIASLIVVKEFLEKHQINNLVLEIEKLINKTNFKKLYTDKELFSIGYDTLESKLSNYLYGNFASESRLTSFIAIAKGDVESKHWLALDKTPTTYKHKKGLIAWSGTSFEYFLPLLFMKNYRHTLLDEAYNFAYFCQKDFMKSINNKYPWGISESAYDELDNSENYHYKSFGIPVLKAKEDKENRIVISPYASLMMISLYPDEVYKNIDRFIDLNMFDKYGFYESYDLQTNNSVKAYFAHHQGMILAGITNYLKDNVLQDYFSNNIKMKTFEILLKEKIQIKTSINVKIAKYKKYDYAKESIENDLRIYNYISELPELSVLSNKSYCLVANDRGNYFSRYKNIQLNRYRKITEQDYGLFLYIKDVKTNKIWSNTYAPLNNKPDSYDVVFASDMIKYIRIDGDITTTTKICVAKDHSAEIRKITFKNDGNKDRELEITSYTEPILSPNMDDVSHRVFNDMFMESFFENETSSLITKRKSRSGLANSYMINYFIIEEPMIKYQYETDRFRFIGRNNSASNPIGLNSRLSNETGINLEPIMSLRNKVLVKANSKTTIYFVNGFGRSEEQVFDIYNNYKEKRQLNKAFDVASLMNIMNTKTMEISGSDMKAYNIMLNYLYQTTKISTNDERKEILAKNKLGQNGLWKYGISGDLPIILIEITDVIDLEFVIETIKCFGYYKNNAILVDLVIINSALEEHELIKKTINDEIYRMSIIADFGNVPGGIHLIDSENINEDERILLNVASRLRFNFDDHKSLKDKIYSLQATNKMSEYASIYLEESIDNNKIDLQFKNTYGGFSEDGNEYIITEKNTPTPWSNIIANEKIGTIITNNGCGFTYAYNSGEFKITSWTNEVINNDKSEGIKINNKVFDNTLCRHGFGYSILESENDSLKKELTEFVANSDAVKIYILKITNKYNHMQDVKVSFWINPVLGNFEEKTARHILTSFDDNHNYLNMRNVYSMNFSDKSVFMSSNHKIVKVIEDKTLIKQIDTLISLDAFEEKTVIFTLGVNEGIDLDLIRKYNDVNVAFKELDKVKNKWLDLLNTVQVKTPDLSFNIILKWYLYQAISSRILARAGFYQVSGAFGYRDQLQDSMNVVSVKPEITKKQILINAMHQFKEGDVLHWWHDINSFGLRSRYKDDYLWLVYATVEYIKNTSDYAILDEKVPYAVGDKLFSYEEERGMVFTISDEEDTLLKHCELSLSLAMNSLGSHGIPLMGGGDWNDGMNKVGIKGKGESVWLGFFLKYIIDKFVNIMKEKNYDVSRYIKFNENLTNNLNKYAWDGDYYLRAFFDNGDKLGSITNEECKIDLISQVFAVLSGVANTERTKKCMDSALKYLVDKENRIVKLLTPAFKKSKNNPGYIMSYPEGIRENGGQYTHAVAWYIMALIEIGNYDNAYEYYQMINPINRTLTDELVRSYSVEPYVIAADIYSNEKYPGRGGWTWYTGSAGWFYKVGIESILGFKKEGNILKIEPNVPTGWKEFSIKYKYFDTIYDIKVSLNSKKMIKVDKKQVEVITLVDDKKTHFVEVSI